MPAPFKRTGLHRLECEACPNYVYATVAALETHGLGRCPCGEPFWPAVLELAMHLGADDAPVVAEFRQRVADAWRGQTSRGPCDTTDRLRPPEVVALEGTSSRPGLRAEWAAQTRARRLIGLGIREVKIGRGVHRSAVTSDEIPF